MRVLITGASGYVGARIYEYLSKYYDAFGSYHKLSLFSELIRCDLTSLRSALSLVRKTKPDIIIHAVGNASSSFCNKYPQLAYNVNVLSTKNIVGAANQNGAKVIYISTTAAGKPYEIYGKTKLEGEKYAKHAKFGYLILRPSLIMGQSPNTKNDRPHNRILRNIIENTEPVYDDSWRFQPTWLDHLSEVIYKSIGTELYGETIPVIVPEIRTRFKLARDILKFFEIKAIRDKERNSAKSIFFDQSKLKHFGLPAYRYNYIIKKTVRDIKKFISVSKA